MAFEITIFTHKIDIAKLPPDATPAPHHHISANLLLTPKWTRNILSQGWHVAVEVDLFRRDLLSVAQAGGGARSIAALYHPLSCCHPSCGIGGSAQSSALTSSPAVSTLCLLSPFRFYVIAPLSLQICVWYIVFRRAETLLSTSLHVSSDIHPFFLRFLACAFGTALRRATEIPSSCVGSGGGQRGSCLRPMRYLVYSLSGALRR